MTAVYWPTDEFDCTDQSRQIARDDIEHQHFERERDACQAFLRHERDYHCDSPDDTCVRPVGKWCLFHQGRRYHCIRGPHGLVRDVLL